MLYGNIAAYPVAVVRLRGGAEIISRGRYAQSSQGKERLEDLFAEFKAETHVFEFTGNITYARKSLA